MGCAALVRLPEDELQSLAVSPHIDAHGALAAALKLHGNDSSIAVDVWSILSQLVDLGEAVGPVAEKSCATLSTSIFNFLLFWQYERDGAPHAVDAITSLLNRHVDSVTLVPVLCENLRFADKSFHQCSPELLRATAYALHRVLKLHAGRLEVVQAALQALSHMIASAAVRELWRASEKYSGVMQLLAPRGIAATLAGIAATHFRDDGAVIWALDALTELDPRQLQGPFTTSLARTAAKALTTHLEGPEVWCSAAGLIDCLAESRESDKALREAGVVELLVETLHRAAAYRGSLAEAADCCQDNIMETLQHIAGFEAVSEHLPDGGVVGAVAAGLAVHVADRDSAYLLCSLLLKLVGTNGTAIPTKAGMASPVGALVSIIHTRKRTWHIVACAMQGLAALAELPGCGGDLISHGVLSAARQAVRLITGEEPSIGPSEPMRMYHNTEDDGLVTAVIELIRLLAGEQRLVPLLLAEGALEMVCAAAEACTGNDRIAASACDALARLSSCGPATAAAPHDQQVLRALTLSVNAMNNALYFSEPAGFEAATRAMAGLARLLCHMECMPAAAASVAAAGSSSSSSTSAGAGAGAAAASQDATSAASTLLPLLPSVARTAELIANTAVWCDPDSELFRRFAHSIYFLCSAATVATFKAARGSRGAAGAASGAAAGVASLAPSGSSSAAAAALACIQAALGRLPSAREDCVRLSSATVAASAGVATKLTAALAAVPGSSAVQPQASDVLPFAVQSGSVAAVKVALKRWPALPAAELAQLVGIASSAGQLSMVDYLLGQLAACTGASEADSLGHDGGDLSPHTAAGAALWLAAGAGRKDVVRQILSRMPPGAGQSIDTVNTGLRLAAMHGHSRVVQLLLQDGGANAAHGGSIALRLAERSGHATVVQQLKDAAAAAEAAAAAAHGGAGAGTGSAARGVRAADVSAIALSFGTSADVSVVSEAPAGKSES